MPKRSRRTLVYGLSALLLGVLAAAVVAEVAVRILLPQPDPMRWFVSDADYGYLNRASFRQSYRYGPGGYVMEVATNSLGLRGEEIPAGEMEDPNRLHVLLLGDSFTFGYGVQVEETFGERLADRLAASGREALVFNSGVGGWGTVQEVTYGRNKMDLYRPDVVVLTFCGNDPSDDVKFRLGLNDNDKGVIRLPGKTWLRNHSQLYRLVRARYVRTVHGFLLRRRAAEREGEPPPPVDAQSASAITADEWASTLREIRTFAIDLLGQYPDSLILVQASAPWEDSIREHLAELGTDPPLLYVDLYDDTVALDPAARRTPHDGHWSPLVHQISADRLYQTIERYLPAD